MEKAIKAIKNFTPCCEQEEIDKELFLDVLERIPNALSRESLIGHFTASAWLMNKTKDKILCCYHKLYNRWQWLGGHCDGDDDFLNVIKKEITEESGLEKFVLYKKGIFSLESFAVKAHYKKGKYIPAHCHWNVTYAFIADEKSATRISEDENSDIGWRTFDEMATEPTYCKLIDRVKKEIQRVTR